MSIWKFETTSIVSLCLFSSFFFWKLWLHRIPNLKSILFSMQSYWMQIFILPIKAMNLIEAHCRSYVWSGTNTITKRALVVWDQMCLPISVGGMNLTNLKIWNKESIAKNCWDFAHKADKLWIKWIHNFYIKGQTLATVKIPKNACWMVRKKIESRDRIDTLQQKTSSKNSWIRTMYLQMMDDISRVE